MSIKTMEKKAKIEFVSVVKKEKKKKKEEKKKKSERGCVVQTLFYF